MARPRVPLISRRKALEAALEIIDSEGLKALSIRRLGEVMNVNGASLYHHFKDKDDILVGVAQLALADVTTPRSDSDNWRVWLPLNAYRTRRALIAHPELIPLMLRRIPLGIGNQEVDASVARLRDEGVEMSVIAPLMESFELLAISSALQTVGGAGSAEERERAHGAEDSMYQQAQKERGLSDDELFEVVCAAVIASVESAVHLKEARASIGTAFATAAAPVPAARAAGTPKTRPARSATARKPVTAVTATATAAAAGKTTVDQPAAAGKTPPRGKTAAARKTVASKAAVDQRAAPAGKTTSATRKPAAAAKAAGTPRKPAAKAATPARKPVAAAGKTAAASRKPAAPAEPAAVGKTAAGAAGRTRRATATGPARGD
jgi:TetR/AcrR family transcriptional regulator, tetracycline repressor protein